LTVIVRFGALQAKLASGEAEARSAVEAPGFAPEIGRLHLHLQGQRVSRPGGGQLGVGRDIGRDDVPGVEPQLHGSAARCRPQREIPGDAALEGRAEQRLQVLESLHAQAEIPVSWRYVGAGGQIALYTRTSPLRAAHREVERIACNALNQCVELQRRPFQLALRLQRSARMRG